MKVLVTGATGFVGRHVVPALLERGHQVIGLGRSRNKLAQLPWGADVDFIPADICRTASIDLSVVGVPDAVMHLAWPGLPNFDGLFHFEQNLPANCSLISSWVRQGVKQVQVTGTCLEYGLKAGPLHESLCTDPVTPYGLAKDTLRRYLELLGQSHPFMLQWARLFYMYGPGQNPNSLLAQLDTALERGDAEFNMSSGEQLRDYLPVTVVADHLVGLLESRDVQGIFNVCSGRPISVRALVERHLAQRGETIRLNLGFYPLPQYEPVAFWGNRSRLDAVLER